MWIYNEPADPPIHLVDATGPLTANMLEAGNYKGAQIHLFYRPAGYSGMYTLCRSDRVSLFWFNIRMPAGTVYDAIIDLANRTVTSLRDKNGKWLLVPEVVGTVQWKRSDEIQWHTSGSIVGRTYFSEGDNPVYLAPSYGTGGVQPIRTATVQIKYQSEEGDMDIVTGYIGEPHITAVQDRDTNRGIFGEESYILDVGDKLAAEVQSATEIRVRDGSLCHQGCVGNISNGTYDALTISNGSQGMLRHDLIVARYAKDADTHAESLTLVVIEGEPAASSPADPAYNEGDIRDGDSPVDMPLYRVNINGVNIDSITRLAPIVNNLGRIGTTFYANVASTSLASGTAANRGSVELPPGTYIIVLSANFGNNATGRRIVSYSLESNTLGSSGVDDMVSVQAASGAVTTIEKVRIVTLSETKTVYCVVRQDSGSSINVNGNIRAVRIA